jgi:hypothetical protein
MLHAGRTGARNESLTSTFVKTRAVFKTAAIGH